MTYRQAYIYGRNLLTECGITEADSDVWLLMAHIFGISRTDYLLGMSREVPQDRLELFEQAIQKRTLRIPLQQITGETEFMSLRFFVSSDVLCPRQDTETLVEEAEKLLKPDMRVLDMCTGSGCIAISLAVRNTDIKLTVDAADLSEAALSVAEKNSAYHSAGISLIHSDLFSCIDRKYDMIVSNPPYIRTGEIADLMPEVAEHEPLMALDGKEDGLYFYRKIIEQSSRFLLPGGKMLFEIGYDQGEDVAELLRKEGFHSVRVIKDLACNDRVVIGEL